MPNPMAKAIPPSIIPNDFYCRHRAEMIIEECHRYGGLERSAAWNGRYVNTECSTGDFPRQT